MYCLSNLYNLYSVLCCIANKLDNPMLEEAERDCWTFVSLRSTFIENFRKADVFEASCCRDYIKWLSTIERLDSSAQALHFAAYRSALYTAYMRHSTKETECSMLMYFLKQNKGNKDSLLHVSVAVYLFCVQQAYTSDTSLFFLRKLCEYNSRPTRKRQRCPETITMCSVFDAFHFKAYALRAVAIAGSENDEIMLRATLYRMERLKLFCHVTVEQKDCEWSKSTDAQTLFEMVYGHVGSAALRLEPKTREIMYMPCSSIIRVDDSITPGQWLVLVSRMGCT